MLGLGWEGLKFFIEWVGGLFYGRGGGPVGVGPAKGSKFVPSPRQQSDKAVRGSLAARPVPSSLPGVLEGSLPRESIFVDLPGRGFTLFPKVSGQTIFQTWPSFLFPYSLCL